MENITTINAADLAKLRDQLSSVLTMKRLKTTKSQQTRSKIHYSRLTKIILKFCMNSILIRMNYLILILKHSQQMRNT